MGHCSEISRHSLRIIMANKIFLWTLKRGIAENRAIVLSYKIYFILTWLHHKGLNGRAVSNVGQLNEPQRLSTSNTNSDLGSPALNSSRRSWTNPGRRAWNTETDQDVSAYGVSSNNKFEQRSSTFNLHWTRRSHLKGYLWSVDKDWNLSRPREPL